VAARPLASTDCFRNAAPKLKPTGLAYKTKTRSDVLHPTGCARVFCLLEPPQRSTFRRPRATCRPMLPGTETHRIRLRSYLLAPSWRGTHCFGRAYFKAPVRGSPMLIEAGFDIAFECLAQAPMLLQLNVHPSRDADLLTPDKINCDPRAPISINLAIALHGSRFLRGSSHSPIARHS
jgi:hypothetical protein